MIDGLGRVAAQIYTYDLADRPLRTESIDAGLRRIVLDAAGHEIERRDGKGALTLQAYDALGRPIRVWARDEADRPLRPPATHGVRRRGHPGTARRRSRRRGSRQPTRQTAPPLRRGRAGRRGRDDFKGNIGEKSRQMISDGAVLAAFETAQADGWQVTPFQVDWQPGPQQTLEEREADLLETTGYTTTSRYDALNRLQALHLPQDVEGHRRELRPEYNRAGSLERVRLDEGLFVERITYDAKGQRALIAYGNGIMTRYLYDPHTLRLTRLRSERYTQPDALTYHPDGNALQDLGYDYDLAGNLVGIRERTPGSGVAALPDTLDRRFEYDPIYRLVSTTGRECDAPPAGPPFQDLPRCTDITRARAYQEIYTYDRAGSLLTLTHRSGSNGFTRTFAVDPGSNQLQQVTVGGDTYSYKHDANGNLRAETTSRHVEVDHADRMTVFRTQTEGAEPSLYAHYVYDASGRRTKKLVRKQGGQVEVTHYVDDLFEHHRFGQGPTSGENNHVHVMDDQHRIALVRTGPTQPGDQGPAVQYHLSDHLGSSAVVLDGAGAAVNREDYTPFGETSFGSFAKKRYRFTGKERDEESGFTYHRARYCAPWLGRWTSPDPMGTADDLNLYAYVSNNPMIYSDQKGTDKNTPVPAADPAKANGTAQDSGDQWRQPHIVYLQTQADPVEMDSVKTGWQDNDYGDDSAVEVSGHWGNWPYLITPEMHNGIGSLGLSLDIEDFRDMTWPTANRTFHAYADIDIHFKQRSGSEPLQLTKVSMAYQTRGGGSLQVTADYTPGGQVESDGRIGFAHSVVLQFTYSNNSSHTTSETEQTGAEASAGGFKVSAGASSTQSTTVTATSVSWVREIQFTSWDVPVGPVKPHAVPAPKGSKP